MLKIENISKTFNPGTINEKAALQGLSLLEIGDTPFGDNTSVARLEAEGDDIRVLYRDDNSHLVQAGLSTLAKQKWWRQKRLPRDPVLNKRAKRLFRRRSLW